MVPNGWRFSDDSYPMKYKNAMRLVEFLWTDEEERELIRKGSAVSTPEERNRANAIMVDMGRRVKAAGAYLLEKDSVSAQSTDSYVGTGNKVAARYVGVLNDSVTTVAVKLYPWRPNWLEWPRHGLCLFLHPYPCISISLSCSEDECFHLCFNWWNKEKVVPVHCRWFDDVPTYGYLRSYHRRHDLELLSALDNVVRATSSGQLESFVL
jgi:hypothetical protein